MPFDKISTVPLTGYAPSTALGIDTTTPQLYISGTDQMWEPVGGGTGANFPINTDITAMQGIPNTVIDSTGYKLGTIAGGSGTVVSNGNILSGVLDGAHKGWELGYDLGSGGDGTLLLSGVGVGVTLSARNGLTMGAGIVCGGVQATSNVTINTGFGLSTDKVQNFTPGTPLTISLQTITGPQGLIFNSGATSLQNLLACTNYPTQSTVGAAGSAAALPANPSFYLQMYVSGPGISAGIYVCPFYKQS